MFDREIDPKELWNWLRSSVDWWFYGMVTLASLNLILAVYLVWSFVTAPDFFMKYQLTPSASLVQKAQNLQEVPSPEEIETEPVEKQQSIPSRYGQLHKENLFVPFDQRGEEVLAEEPSETDEDTQPEETLPRIEGFEIVGRITGQGSNQVSMVKRTDDGKTFVAREGEYLKETDVKVVTVTDTMVRLNRPQHRATRYQFRTDEIEGRIRDAIRIR
jgi:Tfp pilus assembly protein PilP